MTNGAAAGGAAAAAAIAQAIKASGAIVRVVPNDFLTILRKAEDPLVVHAQGGFLSKNDQYLLGYKGLVFFCKSPAPLTMPFAVEMIEAQKMWIPG